MNSRLVAVLLAAAGLAGCATPGGQPVSLLGLAQQASAGLGHEPPVRAYVAWASVDTAKCRSIAAEAARRGYASHVETTRVTASSAIESAQSIDVVKQLTVGLPADAVDARADQARDAITAFAHFAAQRNANEPTTLVLVGPAGQLDWMQYVAAAAEPKLTVKTAPAPGPGISILSTGSAKREMTL